MGKKHKCPEFENHERWVISYADMVTLLFALFVVLYAQGVTDAKKASKVESSMRRSFGIPVSNDSLSAAKGAGDKGIGIFPNYRGNSPIARRIKKYPSELPQHIEIRRDLIKLRSSLETYSNIAQGKKGELEGRVLIVRPIEKGFLLTLFARSFFPKGGATILPSAHKVLDHLAGILKEIKRPIRVEGHTDPSPPNGGRYRDNWELSSARAISVAKYLLGKHNFPPTMISTGGFAHYQPIHSNSTNEGRKLNRRVDIQIIYDPNDR